MLKPSPSGFFGIRQSLCYACFCMALVNFFFLSRNGIVTSGEAAKYIGQQNSYWQQAIWVRQPVALFTETGLIAACLHFHIGLVAVIVLHLVFNFAAGLFFYKTFNIFSNLFPWHLPEPWFSYWIFLTRNSTVFYKPSLCFSALPCYSVLIFWRLKK